MTKYLRRKPAEIRRLPPHRFVRYLHYLEYDVPTTTEEYLIKFPLEKTLEAQEALEWLLEQGLIYECNI